jgi:hypothetical protein
MKENEERRGGRREDGGGRRYLWEAGNLFLCSPRAYFCCKLHRDWDDRNYV